MENLEEFLTEFELDPEIVKRKAPSLAGYKHINDVRLRALYLTNGLELNPKKVLGRFPQVLYLPIDTLGERVGYVTEELGLDVKVFEKNPCVFAYARERIAAVVGYVTSLGLDPKIFERYPRLFDSSEKSLKPNVDFVTQEASENVQVFSRMPALFCYSLRKRLRPRHAFLQQKGRSEKIRAYAVPTDDNFARLYAKTTPEEYATFKAGFVAGYDAKPHAAEVEI